MERRGANREGGSCRVVWEGSDALEKLGLGDRQHSAPRPGTRTGKADMVRAERREVGLYVLSVNVG